MPTTPTPHISAAPGDVADAVLMPGDPLRARFIAENFLEEATCFSEVRGMLGYTGRWRGSRVSVMGSGMGMPSIGIYSYELFSAYGAESIVRVGTAGAFAEGLSLRDIVIAQGACTNSNYASQYRLPGTFAPIASFGLLERAVAAARAANLPFRVGNVLSSDTFYNDDREAKAAWQRMGVLAVEMEAAALYMNAARLDRQALCIVSISDSSEKGEALSSEQRETSLAPMVEVALSAVTS